MTPHEQMTHPDGSVPIRVFAGGRWKVLRGAANGIYDCQAAAFVEAQNRFIRSFHRPAVTAYMGAGEAA